eukprot:32315-Hanusia_phi.AAC.2
MGGSSSKNDFSNQIGTGSLPPGSEELEIDADMTHLDLRLKRLTTLPWDLSVLTNLRELDLSMNLYTQIYNNFITELPEEFCRIPKLQFAFLSNNRLTWLPDGLEQLTCLRGFYLDGNPITELPDGDRANFDVREDLTLCNCSLRHIPEGLSQLTTLKELYFDFLVSDAVTLD